MKRTNGPLARRAGPLLTVATLVAALTVSFLPPGPAPVIALTASPDPGASAAPTPTPDPAASPTPTPTPTFTPLPPGVVSADGGTLSAQGVTVSLPPGAVAAPTRISVTRTSGLPGFDGTPPIVGFSIAADDIETGAPVRAFATPVSVDVSTGGLDLTDIDPADLRLARLGPDGAWQLLATGRASGALDTAVDAPGTFAVVVDVPARAGAVDFDHSSDAPAQGRHRIDPGATLTTTLGVKPAATIAGAQFVETVPAGWTVVDAGTGTWDAQLRLVTWGLGKVPSKRTIIRSLVVRAPLVSPVDGAPAFESTFSSRLTYRGGAADAADVTVLVSPRLVMEHRTLGQADRGTGAATYQPEDEPILNEPVLGLFRVRFQVRNADAIPVSWTPLLQYRRASTTDWATVPNRGYENGVAFYVAPERLRPQADPALPDVPDGPEEDLIPMAAIKMHDRDSEDEQPAIGSHSMGPNPAPEMTIPGRSYSEVEFSVRATVAADYLGVYEFRVTDRGTAIAGAVTAIVQIEPEPPLVLSPGQRQGIWVGGPSDGPTTAAYATSVAYGLRPPTRGVVDAWGTSADVITAQALSRNPRYALLAVAIIPSTPSAPALNAPVVGTHGPYTTTADQCAICHRGHTGQNKSVLSATAPQSTLCFRCHDGTGANQNVQVQYTDASVPANDAATRSYYRHDALVATTHTRADLNEFGGVSNRHSECGDCHNSHKANATNSTQTTTGWTASGRLANISGVAVTNGTAGTAPTYTFRDGITTAIDREYQLCFKCHSGFTTLLSNPTGTPTPYSLYALDKGVELNPNNASYHPIEAAGKNTTTAMTNQLAATSPYKQWTFTTTSTIRCVNCHGDYRKYNLTTPPAAGSDLAPHANKYRGVLLQDYRDRALTQSTEGYLASNFALCYLCHGENPFADTSGNTNANTNFRFHGFHLGNLPRSTSTSYNIDQSGAGRGFAICAECHFRIHSTTYRVGAQPAYPGLVNFAPNVTVGATPWDQTGKSCTLTCHGVSHTGWTY